MKYIFGGVVHMSDDKRFTKDDGPELTDKEKNMENKSDNERTEIDGQPREMIIKTEQDKKDDKRNPLVWLVPIMIVLLIIPLAIFHFSGQGPEGAADFAGGGGEESSEESGGEEDSGGEGSEEGSGEESADNGDGASSGDVDAEGVARDNCATCHGDDFSGGMGPALAGTSLDEGEFTDIVRNGQGQMPSFGEDEVSDEELTAMYDFFSE